MNLRSGRSISTTQQNLTNNAKMMRRDSRNYEEYEERLKYFREQEMIEENIYSDEEDEVDIKIKRINNKMMHYTYALKYQIKNDFPLVEKAKTCIEAFKLINNNLPFIVEHNLLSVKQAKQLVENGNKICDDVWRQYKTRSQRKIYDECRYFIGNVIDIVEHHILKLY